MDFDSNILEDSEDSEYQIETEEEEESTSATVAAGAATTTNNCPFRCCEERYNSSDESSDDEEDDDMVGESDESDDNIPSFHGDSDNDSIDRSIQEANYGDSDEEFEPMIFGDENVHFRDNEDITSSSESHLDTSKKLVAYFLIKYAISRNQLEDMIGMMNIVYKSHCPVDATSIWTYVQTLGNRFVSEKLVYCKHCRSKLTSSNKYHCSNSMCYRSSKIVKNGSSTTPNRVVYYDFEQQLRMLLKPNLNEIIRNHEKIHQNEQVISHKDVRAMPVYKEKIETPDQFKENKLVVVMTCSFDGARPAKLTKREITPLVFRIESLEKSIRNKEENFILSTIHISSQGVKKEDMELFTRRFIEEYENLVFNGFEMNHEGVDWKIHINVLGVLSDMKGARCINGLPDWQKLQGCSVCTTTGERNYSVVSFNSLTDSPLRTVASCMDDMKKKLNGHVESDYCKFAWYFVAVLLFLDLFHIRKEGVVKKAVKEIVQSQWEWSKFRDARKEPVEMAVEDTKSLTNETSILTVKSVAYATGSQIQAIGMIALPLASLTRSFIDPTYSYYLLSILSVLWNEEEVSTYDDIREILSLGFQLYVSKEPKHVTLKGHAFFKHQLMHLTTYGVRFDMEPFEKLHSKFQQNINIKGTNVFDTYGSRFLAKSFLTSSIKSMLSTKEGYHRDVIAALLFRESSSPFGIINFIPAENLSDSHRAILENYCNLSSITKYGSRVHVEKTNLKSIKIDTSYWREKSTSSSIFRKKTRNGMKFMEALLFFEIFGQTKVIVNVYDVVPFKQLVIKLFDDVKSSQSPSIVDICSGLNKRFEKIDCPFEKVLGTRTEIHDVTDIVSGAVIVPFENDEFLTVYH